MYEHDKYNQPIFTYPVNITSTSNGDIHVADYKPGSVRGRVVVLEQGRDRINTYTGHTDVNKGILFKLVRIVSTPRDNVIVTDMDTYTLHILNNNGQLLSFYKTSNIEIKYPFSFAFTQTGQLLNGCSKPVNSKAKDAKIFTVNISGWEITQSNVGVLQSKVSPLELSVTLNINKQYQTELSQVSDIIPLSDNSICLNSNLYGKLMKVKPEGNNLKTTSSLNIDVYGVTLTAENDILLDTGNSRIQQLSNITGKITDTVYDISPLKSTTVHMTCNNKVVVGAVNKHGMIVVMVMNKKGENETIYEHDKYNQPIFTYPVNITSTSNGDIHMADYKPGSVRGRVVVLEQGRDRINTYTGHTDVNKGRPFKLVRIVSTPRDNVIVTDMDTYTLHILNNNGQLLSFYKTSKI
ncbi:uncharacterized protein LOC127733699 [Mytilus californianus]|uniref:uncharacterized protein LOC127733699 n=1 Tax=Mytilus californianus TaxID=6549 RepID=UPI00224724D3|nr:uncharacterized protein LOC127733699 [Mytilus californianus]